jgi:hypothetical protein
VSRTKKSKIEPPAFLQTLSKPPEGPWPHGVLFHGSRIGLLVALAVVITFLFPSETGRTLSLVQEGDVATEDLAAEVPFDIPKDSAELDRDRADAAAAVPPVFEYNPETQDRVESALEDFFGRINEAADSGGRAAVVRVLENQGLTSLVPEADKFLNPIEVQALQQATLSVVRELSDRVVPSDYEEEVQAAGRIQYFQEGVERSRPADELLWGTGFYNRAVELLGPSTSEFQSIVRILLIHFFDSPYTLDARRTEARRARERSAVPVTEGNVVEGEYIVRRGDRIGPDELRRMNAHQEALQEAGILRDPGPDWGTLAGSLVLNTLLLGIFGVLLFFFRQEVYRSFRWILLIFVLVFFYFLAGAGISWQGYPWELLPVAFVVLPVAILWDGRMALILALVLGVLSGAQGPFNTFPILAVTVVGGSAAALSARAVRRRSETWIFIALITLGYALAITAFGLMGDRDPGSVLVSILYAGLNATVSSILAMGFMPVFEWATGITTDQTLLEWADPNRPLLKSLSLEASGTYAHTINVANLAEAAATAIGANGLLARVGVYYHDVGKMLKPQFFVENQPGSRNPHDKLKPHTSAGIVREHVIEGERMAREEGVPDVVARFIPEHHGTQLIGFFYERAREESYEEPDEEAFRYPGPKPQSKETAISMLADSVESATRALQEPSPQRIRELVRGIVETKIQDGQLSECPLTLREISVIEEQFAKVVSGMFHHRLDYPATRHLTESQGEKEPGAARASGPGAPTEESAGVLEEQLPLTPAEEEGDSAEEEGDSAGKAGGSAEEEADPGEPAGPSDIPRRPDGGASPGDTGSAGASGPSGKGKRDGS